MGLELTTDCIFFVEGGIVGALQNVIEVSVYKKRKIAILLS